MPELEAITFLQYIRPELFILIPVIYAIGIALKKSDLIKDRFIPLALGGTSVGLCLLYFLSETTIESISIIFKVLLLSIIQGVLIAACSTYTNQIIKQFRKEK